MSAALVSYIIPARNKEATVTAAIECALAQTYSNMEILISNHGSTDRTDDYITKAFFYYQGPHKIRVLQCPETEFKGIVGFNVHLNWIMQHAKGDVITVSSADDVCEPDKIAKVMEVFEAQDPSYVGTAMGHQMPDGERIIPDFPDRRNRFIATPESIRHIIGAPCCGHWTRRFWDKYAPMVGMEAIDMLLPIMATFEDGLYYLAEDLHTQIQHSAPDIVGMEGQLRAAQDDEERLQLTELTGFQYTYHWLSILKRIHAHGHGKRLTGEGVAALHEKIVEASNGWATSREEMTVKRMQPMKFRV